MDPPPQQQRPPMSERQQLALLKRLERTSEDANECVSLAEVTSPPRAPLQIVNGCKHKQSLRGHNAVSTASIQSPSAQQDSSSAGSMSHIPRTPGEERVMKRIAHLNSRGETFLHKAAIKGSAKLVEKLLRLGADPNVRDHAGYTPLHEACNVGQLSVVKLLYKHGAQINVYGGQYDRRETPLHDAAINGHLKVVKYLLKHGADLKARRDNGLDVLEYASFNLLYGKEKESTPRLKQVVQYLTGIQENGGNVAISDVEDSESDEDNDKDIAAFLGISNSPSVHKFLRTVGVVSEEIEAKTTVADKGKPQQRTRRIVKKDSSSRRKSVSTSKARLSFDMEDKAESNNGSANTSAIVATASTNPSKNNDDIYEFKSGAKDQPPAPATVSAKSSASALPDPAGAAEKSATAKDSTPAASVAAAGVKEKTTEKRATVEEEEEESRRKKQRKDEGKEPKGGRSTRGNSSEKTTAGKPQSSTTTGKCKPPGGSTDRKSPTSLSGSAANSPKKCSPADQSDSDDDSKKSTDSSGLKVPPLKIVLSGPSGANGSNGGNSAGTQAVEGDAKRGTTSASSSYAVSKDESDLCGINKNDDDCDDNAGNRDSEGSEGRSGGGNGGPSGSAASRITRSRANQGTPGPEGSSADLPGNTSEASSTNTQDNNSSSNERSERSHYTEYHVKKRKLRSQVDEQSGCGTSSQLNNGGGGGSGGSGGGGGNGAGRSGGGGSSGGGGNGGGANEPLNDIQKYLKIRKQVEQRRKNLFPVHPKPPQGYRDYLMNRKTYLLESNATERLRSMPMIQPPPSLDGPLRELFIEQEKARYQLRKRHLVEKEKLVLTVEQEIIRVHGRAARALANQPFPYSVCTILRDEEIYTPIDSQQEEKNRDIRSRYNGRLFLSWLQDVDDKWEKIKEQMVLRHHNEAESLNAVQKMDWEWKLGELSGNSSSSDSISLKVDDLYIPMVHVSDDFDLSDNR